MPLNVTHAKISLRDTVSLELGEAAVSAKPAVFSFFISGFAQFLFESFGRRFQFVMETFSSPEAAIHLASAMDRDLWPTPIFSPRFTDFRSFCAVSYFYQNGGPGNKFWTRNSKFQRHHIKRKTI